MRLKNIYEEKLFELWWCLFVGHTVAPYLVRANFFFGKSVKKLEFMSPVTRISEKLY